VEKLGIAHSNPYFNVLTARVEMLNGEIIDPYYITEYLNESVAVIPVRNGSEVLLIRAWRPVTGELWWEVPAGIAEGPEAPADAARRELLEETGWEATGIHDLGWFHPSNASSTERTHLFVAPNPRQVGDVVDQREIAEARWMSGREAHELIRTHQITDASTLIGLLRAFQLKYLRDDA